MSVPLISANKIFGHSLTKIETFYSNPAYVAVKFGSGCVCGSQVLVIEMQDAVIISAAKYSISVIKTRPSKMDVASCITKNA